MAWVTVNEAAAKNDRRIGTMGERALVDIAKEVSTRIRSAGILTNHLNGTAVVAEWQDLSPITIKLALNEDRRVLAECLNALQAVIDGTRIGLGLNEKSVIERCMTISTAHISEETASCLKKTLSRMT